MPAGPNCLHEVGVWQAWRVENDADFVLLGDLSAYVSLSGYRFRLPPGSKADSDADELSTGEKLVVVGMPGEEVRVTYLRKNAGKWLVAVQEVVIGSDGRSPIALK